MRPTLPPIRKPAAREALNARRRPLAIPYSTHRNAHGVPSGCSVWVLTWNPRPLRRATAPKNVAGRPLAAAGRRWAIYEQPRTVKWLRLVPGRTTGGCDVQVSEGCEAWFRAHRCGAANVTIYAKSSLTGEGQDVGFGHYQSLVSRHESNARIPCRQHSDGVECCVPRAPRTKSNLHCHHHPP